MNYYFPIILIVGSNVAYHISSKGIPGQMNFMVALIINYFVAGFLSLAMFYLLPQLTSMGQGDASLWAQIKETNWAPILMGVTVLGLELGNIIMYRVGWDISLGSLVSNIALAVLLIVIGTLFYKEVLTLNHGIGIILCLIGLVFVSK